MTLQAAAWAPVWVFMGAGLGALLRWVFGLWWNAPVWPWGTLAANWVGGLGIGLLTAALAHSAAWGWSEDTAKAVRLFAMTGFLGGLTTFSTFSAEVVGFALESRWAEAAGWAVLHLLGSLALTGVGWWAGLQVWQWVGPGG